MPKNFMLIVSTIYSYLWAVCKILFGIFTLSFSFCISGANTLSFGLIKQIYLKKKEQQQNCNQAISISILLIISGILFTLYMARLFFIEHSPRYGLIVSIAIAGFAFTELGLSIYKFIKAKKSKDILLQSFRAYNLVSSSFSIVLTQIALLSATQTSGNIYNAITGVVFGICAILVGSYMYCTAKKSGRTLSK